MSDFYILLMMTMGLLSINIGQAMVIIKWRKFLIKAEKRTRVFAILDERRRRNPNFVDKDIEHTALNMKGICKGLDDISYDEVLIFIKDWKLR